MMPKNIPFVPPNSGRFYSNANIWKAGIASKYSLRRTAKPGCFNLAAAPTQ
jgi:hypothetical protein